VRLTNSAEAAAFFVARAIIVAILFVANPYVLAPLYTQLFRSGGSFILVTILSLSVGFVAWLVTLALFVALRGGFGGTPPWVAGDRGRNAVTSSGGEIGAYLIAVLVVMVVFTALNTTMAGVYASLRQSGGAAWVTAAGLAFSAVAAVVCFLIFTAVRSAMPGVPSADAPIEFYDEGGASMGFGRAIATCFRKYAVFSGRASRSEYWYFVLFQTLVVIGFMIVDILAFRGSANVLSTLAMLIMFLPYLAVSVRRLHDLDMSGGFIFLTFIPLIGWILMIVWACQRGTPGPNRFGMGPAGATIPEVFA
jgi:uncharacterized membrane protein YhaH (DUF805 family)